MDESSEARCDVWNEQNWNWIWTQKNDAGICSHKINIQHLQNIYISHSCSCLMLIPSCCCCCYGLQHDFACINIWKDQINIVSAKLERFTRNRRREKSNCNRLLIRWTAAARETTTYNLFMLPPVPLTLACCHLPSVNLDFFFAVVSNTSAMHSVFTFSRILSVRVFSMRGINIIFNFPIGIGCASRVKGVPAAMPVWNEFDEEKINRKIGNTTLNETNKACVTSWHMANNYRNRIGIWSAAKMRRDAMLVALLLSYGNHKIELLVWLDPINWNASCVRNRTTAHVITSHGLMQRQSMAH